MLKKVDKGAYPVDDAKVNGSLRAEVTRPVDLLLEDLLTIACALGKDAHLQVHIRLFRRNCDSKVSEQAKYPRYIPARGEFWFRE